MSLDVLGALGPLISGNANTKVVYIFILINKNKLRFMFILEFTLILRTMY